MQSDFEAKHIKNAKSFLEKELQMAQDKLNFQKEHEEEMYDASSLWMKIKVFLKRFI